MLQSWYAAKPYTAAGVAMVWTWNIYHIDCAVIVG